MDDDLKIKEIVITRTFSLWEEVLIRKNMRNVQQVEEEEK